MRKPLRPLLTYSQRRFARSIPAGFRITVMLQLHRAFKDPCLTLRDKRLLGRMLWFDLMSMTPLTRRKVNAALASVMRWIEDVQQARRSL